MEKEFKDEDDYLYSTDWHSQLIAQLRKQRVQTKETILIENRDPANHTTYK